MSASREAKEKRSFSKWDQCENVCVCVCVCVPHFSLLALLRSASQLTEASEYQPLFRLYVSENKLYRQYVIYRIIISQKLLNNLNYSWEINFSIISF